MREKETSCRNRLDDFRNTNRVCDKNRNNEINYNTSSNSIVNRRQWSVPKQYLLFLLMMTAVNKVNVVFNRPTSRILQTWQSGTSALYFLMCRR